MNTMIDDEDDLSKFYPEAAKIMTELGASGVLLVVIGSRKGNGAAAAIRGYGWPEWRATLPKWLRGIADSIEKQSPPPGAGEVPS